MELLARAFPLLATIAVGAAHAFAWRGAALVGTWGPLCAAYAVLALLALMLLRREEVLGETLQLVPGDVSRGIAGAAVAVALLLGVGLLCVRFAPMRTFEELRALIFVATRVPLEWQRALALVALAASSELVFRGAVGVQLEGRYGSARAPWLASALYVLAAIPSLHPAVIAAAAVVGTVTAFLVSRFRRVTLAMVTHAAFAWLAVEFVLPSLWQKLLVPVP
jgi:hypothetical protein